jgi:hypothetical protein
MSSHQESDILPFQVEDIVLPFVPYSTAEHWLIAADPEEVLVSSLFFPYLFFYV